MKILIYSGNFFPEKTGIGKYTGEMAFWLGERKHRVEVVTGFPYYPEWKLALPYKRTGFRKEKWNNVVVHRLPHYIPRDGRATSARRMLLDVSIFIAGLTSFLRLLVRPSKRPDVIIAVSPPLLSGVWPLIISSLFGTPWIYHIQDFQIDAAMQLGMLRGAFIGRLLYRIERQLIRSAARVSSISPAMCRRAELKGASKEQLLSLPNWSDLARIKPLNDTSAFRTLIRAGSDQVVVLYAGAMGQKQGLGLILDAAERLAHDARFLFAMVGTGSEADLLRGTAEQRQLSNVTFLPLQPVERLNEMLNAADIHLVVQKSSAADLVMPSKLTNALASGKPVIVTASPGTDLHNVVSQSNSGLVIPPEDLESMVTALTDLANDAAGRKQMGANARHYAEEHLDKDRILQVFESELQHIFDSRRGK